MLLFVIFAVDPDIPNIWQAVENLLKLKTLPAGKV
jgi:hypothetical protein